MWQQKASEPCKKANDSEPHEAARASEALPLSTIRGPTYQREGAAVTPDPDGSDRSVSRVTGQGTPLTGCHLPNGVLTCDSLLEGGEGCAWKESDLGVLGELAGEQAGVPSRLFLSLISPQSRFCSSTSALYPSRSGPLRLFSLSQPLFLPVFFKDSLGVPFRCSCLCMQYYGLSLGPWLH